ncbi:MAG: AGE family epimerase/isomerase [Proteobacteria bacterium]|nr:AGE family epimerase/isomerase [Pseudomonadota bacterium]
MKTSVLPIIFSFILTLTSTCFSPGCGGGEFQFQSQFDAIFKNLNENFWSEDGNWEGDMMGDATAFAPPILFQLGIASNDPALMEKARKTTEWEIKSIGLAIQSIISGGTPTAADGTDILTDALFGGPGLVEGYRYTGENKYLMLAGLGLSGGSEVLSLPPSTLEVIFNSGPVAGFTQAFAGKGFSSPVTAIATLMSAIVAHTDFELYRASGIEKYKVYGKGLLDRVEQYYWNPGLGFYGSALPDLWDWAVGTMIMSLALGFQLTGETVYLDRAVSLIETTDQKMLDPDRGGYFAGDKSVSSGKSLSGNNIFIWAFLNMFEATGNPEYLERARKVIEFVLSRDMYEKGMIYHHWIRPSGEGDSFHWSDQPPGRADYYCTGCNFMSLVNIYNYNKLRQQ